MKILVFVKQVPDTDDVKLDERGNLKRDGVASMINPLDANAVEAAIQLKEKYGATVVAISMGPPQAPKRSATTTCCCSGATPLTATPLRQVRRPQPFSASRRLPLHRASM